MTDQVQCPHCGGYKVGTERRNRIDPKTGKNYGQPPTDKMKEDVSNSGCLFIMVIFFPLLILYLIVYIIAAIADNALVPKDVLNEYSYICSLCGYKWTWRENDPLPPVEVRPDLIVQGEQSLEEKRKRDDEDYRNAGMWMNKK